MKRLLKNKKQALLWSVLINLLLAAGLFLLFDSGFENNDDVGVMIRELGAKGVYEPHLIYVNYVCGLVLTGLYRFWHRIPWHALVQYGLLFVSFTSFLYVVLKRAKHTAVTWMSLVVLFFFAYEGYIKLQYTKTAGIISVCGIMMLLFAVENTRWNIPALIAGYVLCAFGFMYRSTQFFAEGALMTGAAVFLLMDLKAYEKKVRFAILRKYVIACMGLFVCLGVLYGIDRYAYSSEEWKEFETFNKVRTELFDYGFPSYEEHEEEYQALGINQNAFALYRAGNTMDPEKFSTEVMQQVAAMKTPKKINGAFIREFVNTIPPGLTEYRVFYCFLILLLFRLLFLGTKKKQVGMTLVYQFVLTGLIYFYMFYSGRYLLNRVEVGIWLAQCAVLLWTFAPDEPYLTNRQGLLVLFSLLCISQTSMRKNWRCNVEDETEAFLKERTLLENLAADTEHVYLAKMGTVSIFRSYDIYDEVRFGITKNIYQYGGWSGRTPSEIAILHAYGIENPYKDLINSDVAYLLDKEKGVGKTMTYIHDYYDANAEAIEVADFGLCKAYKIVSE